MNKNNYGRIIEAVTALPWAILPAKLAAIEELLTLRAEGKRLTAEEIAARLADGGNYERRSGGFGSGAPLRQGVAVLPLIGTIIPRGNMFLQSSGAVSVQQFTRLFREALADPDVGHIVIDVDSPGGQVGGVAELADEIYNARGVKPVTAVVNHLMASAAYWAASGADELVISPSGQVGSVGVFAIHQNHAKALKKAGVEATLISAGRFKTEGNPYGPLDEEGQAAIQRSVDGYYDLFVEAVARGRGVDPASVRDGFGEGRVLGAADAAAEFMVDRIATLDEVIGEALRGLSAPHGAMADIDFRTRRLRAYGR